MKDYYKILGVSRDADERDIRMAFRELSKKYHPDTTRGDKKAGEDKFKEVNEAYQVLSDSKPGSTEGMDESSCKRGEKALH